MTFHTHPPFATSSCHLPPFAKTLYAPPAVYYMQTSRATPPLSVVNSTRLERSLVGLSHFSGTNSAGLLLEAARRRWRADLCRAGRLRDPERRPRQCKAIKSRARLPGIGNRIPAGTLFPPSTTSSAATLLQVPGEQKGTLGIARSRLLRATQGYFHNAIVREAIFCPPPPTSDLSNCTTDLQNSKGVR